MKKPSPLIAIFLTVMFDMLAFGMAIPDLQIRSETLGAKGATVGFMLASFSLAQFLTAPILGRISDRNGRRFVLLITCALSIVSFLIYSQAAKFGMIILSRVLGGIAGANIGVAFAYIADTTEPQNRAKGMGLVGAAFGMGFIFGPPLGATLVEISHGKPDLLGYVSALFALINLVFVFFFLPEPKVHNAPEARGLAENVKLLWAAVRRPGFGELIVLYFVSNFAFSNLESTFFLLMHQQYGFSRIEGAKVLVVVGIVAAITQGALIGHFARRFGEGKLIRYGYICMSPLLLGMAFAPPWIPIIVVSACVGFVSGLTGPSITSLISRNAPDDMQGGVSGISQSAGALARIAGPIIANSLFAIKFWAPYLSGAIFMCIPILIAWRFRVKETGPVSVS